MPGPADVATCSKGHDGGGASSAAADAAAGVPAASMKSAARAGPSYFLRRSNFAAEVVVVGVVGTAWQLFAVPSVAAVLIRLVTLFPIISVWQ